jgi:hypothetical protein
LHGRGDDDLGTRGKDIVGKQIRIRTKCDVTGKFRWLDARVLGFEERDKVPFHCLELLDATTLSREPIWMYLKRGNHTLLETVRIAGKRKEKEVVGKQDTDDIGEGTSHAGQASTMLSRHDPEAQNTQNGVAPQSSAFRRVSAWTLSRGRVVDGKEEEAEAFSVQPDCQAPPAALLSRGVC